jgi:hypothetical protein
MDPEDLICSPDQILCDPDQDTQGPNPQAPPSTPPMSAVTDEATADIVGPPMAAPERTYTPDDEFIGPLPPTPAPAPDPTVEDGSVLCDPPTEEEISSVPTQYELDSEIMTPAPSQSELDRQQAIFEQERERREYQRIQEARREEARAAAEAANQPREPVHDVDQVGSWGPYRYSHVEHASEDNIGGEGGGFGLGHHNGDRGGFDVGAHYGIGHWRDMDDQEYYGIRVHGGVLTGNGNQGPGGGLAGDGGILDFDAGVYDDGSTFSMGAQASVVEAAGELQTASDQEQDTDSSLRVGGSEGPGFAFRFHHGDSDGDEVPEYGIGVDAGPVSVDLTSEVFSSGNVEGLGRRAWRGAQSFLPGLLGHPDEEEEAR